MSDALLTSVLVLGLGLWLAGATWGLARTRFWCTAALAATPPRQHRLSVLPVLALFLLYMVVLVGIGALTGSLATLEQLPKTPEGFVEFMLLDTIAKSLAILAAIPLIELTISGGLHGFGLALPKAPRGLALGLLAALLILPWLFLVQAAAGYISEALRHGPPPLHPVLRLLAEHPTPRGELILLASACLVAPIVEEIFFRGLLQTALQRPGLRLPAHGGPVSPILATLQYLLTGPRQRWLAILVVALLFTAIHFTPATPNFEVLPPLLLLALTLGYLYERTGNLWATITLHAIFNAVNTIAFITGHGQG